MGDVLRNLDDPCPACQRSIGELGRRDGLCYYHGKIADALMADLVHTSTHAKPTPREEIA